ncbi:MAG: DNA polymerase III subunit alpha, partial [Clostridia bacterium]|nr:DNA polymerase III subunit alpha [Clostridia bacterium]
LIGITDVDPLTFDLLFERFLNPERVSMPDFDIDFADNRRDEAIEYVREKYGDDHTAQIITFGTMAARAVIRDVGRALDMSYGEVDSVAKLIPKELNITLEDALKNKEFHEKYASSHDIRKLVDISRALEGMPRHASTHAAGVVITERPLSELVPLARNNGITVTQFDMNTVAELGLLKFDFLAIRYLTVIDSCEKLIKAKDPSFSLSDIRLDDKATYQVISKGDTDGVFQLESPGMKQMLQQLKPESIDDIIAAIALFRPGPMSSIPKYIEARHKGGEVEYPSPLLKPILDSTYGCIVYQEQVMQIFCSVAGYSLGHADIVRRAISKKHADELMREKDAFIDGAESHGMARADAEKLFKDIEDFAKYAFNKSHAVVYAVTSYRTAYLKTHYKVEYNCALITSVLSSTDKICEYLADCRKKGIAVLPPDVNNSRTDFSAENGAIRFGLAALKNVGVAFIDQLVAERESGGEFKSFDDFFSRMEKHGLNKRQAETLIKAGALDCLGVYRSRMLAVFEQLLDHRGSSDKMEGQLDFFSAMDADELSVPETAFPEIPEFTTAEKLKMEKEVSGMYLSVHILDDYKENIKALSPASVSSILKAFGDEGTEEYRENQTVCICASVLSRSDKNTKSGERMSFVTVEDGTGEIELIVFPKIFALYSHLLTVDSPVALVGKISIKDDEAPKLILNEGVFLSHDGKAPSYPPSMQPKVKEKEKGEMKLYLRVPSLDSEEFSRVSAFLSIFSGIVPVVVYDAKTKKPSALKGSGASVNSFTVKELQEMLGEENVVIK